MWYSRCICNPYHIVQVWAGCGLVYVLTSTLLPYLQVLNQCHYIVLDEADRMIDLGGCLKTEECILNGVKA